MSSRFTKAMAHKLTPGKLAGLKAVANARGVIAAAAMDQRGLLKKMLVKESNGREITQPLMTQFKEQVAASLTQHASAILLDVEYGLPAIPYSNGKGVMLAYEKSGYDATAPEFLPSVTEGWSVLRLKEAGAAAVKVLVYYTPFETPWVNKQKQAWVERIGAECRAIDIPMFLEFLGYDVHGEGERSVAYARRKPEIVLRSMEEFSKDRYGADVLKVEVPVQMRYVAGTAGCTGEQAYTSKEAEEHFRNAASASSKPFVYLSAGVSNATFLESLQLAIASGVHFHGVLCGRATWQGGVPVFAQQGAQAFRHWLDNEGAQNIQRINRVLEAAYPWHEHLGHEHLDRAAIE